MAKMLILYYTRTKHTHHMAEAIAEGAKGVGGLAVEVKSVAEVTPKDLLNYEAILMGSPTYYGTMAAELKKLLDDSVSIHTKLTGKVGGAFASSANVGGGNETTILDIINAQLIHGMVVQGTAVGDHYGPVAINDVDARAKKECLKYGKMLGELTIKLHG